MSKCWVQPLSLPLYFVLEVLKGEKHNTVHLQNCVEHHICPNVDCGSVSGVVGPDEEAARDNADNDNDNCTSYLDSST